VALLEIVFARRHHRRKRVPKVDAINRSHKASRTGIEPKHGKKKTDIGAVPLAGSRVEED
jgi:hypothetical protein